MKHLELAAASILATMPMVALGVDFPAVVTLELHEPMTPWLVMDCSGSIVQLDSAKPLPPCINLASPTGARVKIDQRLGAQVAGASGGTRTVYAATASRTRGAALGSLTVGTVAKPLGYYCDPTDTIRSGATVYSRLTDPAIPAALRQYTSGCQ